MSIHASCKANRTIEWLILKMLKRNLFQNLLPPRVNRNEVAWNGSLYWGTCLIIVFLLLFSTEVVKEKVKLVQLTELLEKAMNNPVYQASVCILKGKGQIYSICFKNSTKDYSWPSLSNCYDNLFESSNTIEHNRIYLDCPGPWFKSPFISIICL